jgi:hypothetical protein
MTSVPDTVVSKSYGCRGGNRSASPSRSVGRSHCGKKIAVAWEGCGSARSSKAELSKKPVGIKKLNEETFLWCRHQKESASNTCTCKYRCYVTLVNNSPCCPVHPHVPLSLLRLPQDRLDHLVPQLCRLRKPGFKILLNLLKLLSVPIEIAQIDTGAPIPRGESERQVVGTESVVVDGGVNGFFEECGVAKEVFGNTEPHARRLWDILVRRMLQEKMVCTGVEQIMWS